MSDNGGQPEVVVAAKPGEAYAGPQMLNNGSALLFSVAAVQGSERWDRGQIVVQSVGSSERRVILQGGSAGHYAPTGHLLYMVGGTLLASALDVKTLQLRGNSVPIVEGIRRFSPSVLASGVASFAVSSEGTFAYVQGSASSEAHTLALASHDGKLRHLDVPPQRYSVPRISPDGTQLAVQSDDETDSNIWIYDLKGAASARKLTFGGRAAFPLWTPDSRRITFQSDRDGDRGIFWQLADGSSPAVRLAKADGAQELRPEAWNADGKLLALSVNPPAAYRLFTLVADGAQAPKPLSSVTGYLSAFSPDGKWLAYASSEIGNRIEVFVQPFPPTGSKYQVSFEGGRGPVWSPDGKRLYYHANLTQRFIAVDVRTLPAFGMGKRVALPIEANFFGTLARNYDITPDGQQFVVMTPLNTSADSKPSEQHIKVVLNWFEELKRLVPP